MLNALPESVRNTLCGWDPARAERAKAGPRHQPHEPAQQPRAQAAASNPAQQRAQRRLPRRHRQLGALGTPRPGLGERLAPPLAPAAQRAHRNRRSASDRFQPRAIGDHQRTHHREQRRDAESSPEETRRRRHHATPAATTAQAAPSGIGPELRRQTVGLARVGGAVQSGAATRAVRRATSRRLGLVDLLQKGPDTGVGKNGVREKPVRHWRESPRKWQLSRDKLPGALLARSPGGAYLRTSPSASRIPVDRLRNTAPAQPARCAAASPRGRRSLGRVSARRAPELCDAASVRGALCPGSRLSVIVCRCQHRS